MFPEQTPASLPPSPSGSSNKPLLLLAIFFGVGTLIFGFFSVTQYLSARTARNTLSSNVQAAYKKGQGDQKKLDDDRYQEQNETPFRAYIAPEEFGGFTLKFPKDWNGYLDQNLSGSPQLNLTLNPELVKVVRGDDNVYAFHLLLNRQTYDDALKAKAGDVKGGKLKMTTVTVSGITGSRFEGKYDGKHDGITVVIPVRDKTMVFSTDDRKYSPEFQQILAQSKINP